MDEIKKGQEGNQTSADKKETTPEETPTLTESQVKVREAKARSDALAEVGRLKKAADDANKIAQSVIKRLQEREEADLRREEEAIKDDPEKLSTWRMKRDALRRIAEAEEKERKVQEKETEIQTERLEILQHRADRLSEKYNVDVAVLLKYGGDNKDSMEELAKSFGEKTEPSGESEKPKGRVTSPPDSGKTKGGGKALTATDIKDMSPDERYARRDEISKIPLGVL